MTKIIAIDIIRCILLLIVLINDSTAEVNGLSTKTGEVLDDFRPSMTSSSTTTTSSSCGKQLDGLQNCTKNILRQDDGQPLYTPPTSPDEAYVMCRTEIRDTTHCAQKLLDVASMNGKGHNNNKNYHDDNDDDDDDESSLLSSSSSSLSKSGLIAQASLLSCLPWKFNWEFCLNYQGDACSLNDCNEAYIDDDEQTMLLLSSSSIDESTTTTTSSSSNIITRRGGFLPDMSCEAFRNTLRHGNLCCEPCRDYMVAYEGCIRSYKTCGYHDNDKGNSSDEDRQSISFSSIMSLLFTSSSSTTMMDDLIAHNRRYIALALLIIASPLVIFSFLRQVCALTYWRCCRSRRRGR